MTLATLAAARTSKPQQSRRPPARLPGRVRMYVPASQALQLMSTHPYYCLGQRYFAPCLYSRQMFLFHSATKA
jgi:hypothetical protein